MRRQCYHNSATTFLKIRSSQARYLELVHVCNFGKLGKPEEEQDLKLGGNRNRFGSAKMDSIVISLDW